MLKRILFVAIVCVVTGASAFADGMELTPILGYRFSSDLNGMVASDGSQGSFSVESGDAYGLVLGGDLGDRAAIELSYMKQSTDFKASSSFEHLVAPDRVSVNHYQLGVLFYVPTKNKAIRPFFDVAIGAENFSANNGFDSQSAFTIAGGGGAKFYFGNHFGLRLQASLISAQIPGGHENFCNGDGVCYSKKDSGSLNQGELTAGFIFKF